MTEDKKELFYDRDTLYSEVWEDTKTVIQQECKERKSGITLLTSAR